ncbi:MAG: hypothetical protein ACUZ8H_11375 [Candidatus Anammoxibacter sp.]
MVKIDISGKDYDMPNDWQDITMRQLLDSQKLLKEMPDKMRQLTFPEKKKATPKITDNDEIEFWEFYRKWLVFWTDISDETSKKIQMDGLKLAYEVLQIFMFTPEDIDYKEKIRFKGVNYALPAIENLISGQTKYMANSTYEEFVEGMQLTALLGKLQQGDLSTLPLLTATFYREEINSKWYQRKGTKVVPYDEEGTKKRAEIFMDLPMSNVWGAYFFLIIHLKKSLSGLQTSLPERVQEMLN